MTLNAAIAMRGPDDFVAADSLEAEAARRLAAATPLMNAASPGARSFFDAFYRGASPEDVARYAPEDLATLAGLVYSHATERKAGETLVTLFEFRADAKTHARNETVLLAVNDDMPFLLDW